MPFLVPNYNYINVLTVYLYLCNDVFYCTIVQCIIVYFFLGLPHELSIYWHQYPFPFGELFCKLRSFLSEMWVESEMGARTCGPLRPACPRSWPFTLHSRVPAFLYDIVFASHSPSLLPSYFAFLCFST